MSEQTSEQKRPSAEGGTPSSGVGQTYAKWLGVGIEFGGVIAVFCYIGFRIDAAYNTSPYFLMGGFFFSFTGMLYMIIKQAMDNRRK